MKITRENLLVLFREEMQRQHLTISGLERRAGVPKDILRDFLRGKTQIPRADRLQALLEALDIPFRFDYRTAALDSAFPTSQ